MSVRPLCLADLPGLQAVQRQCYGADLVEGTDVFARRLAHPANCSAVIAQDGQVRAYLVAYRSCWGQVTPLHGDFSDHPTPDTLYLHDLAVLPELGGQGMAARLLHTLWQGAQRRGLQRAALVSVQGSQGFWQHHGYVAYTLQDTAQRERLAAYGRDAVYMMRRLDSAPL